jgi:hypothetical protein
MDSRGPTLPDRCAALGRRIGIADSLAGGLSPGCSAGDGCSGRAYLAGALMAVLGAAAAAALLWPLRRPSTTS